MSTDPHITEKMQKNNFVAVYKDFIFLMIKQWQPIDFFTVSHRTIKLVRPWKGISQFI